MSRLQQNIQGAQSQLTELRNALAKIGAGSEADLEMPDFKPNSQKTKSFLKRLEYGMNLQSQKARFYFPVTSDIGFSVGYKLNDNGMVGIGASYKLGLGTGWKNIKLTNQGIGLRSFIDWKIKKNFWLSGGYEMNYRSELQRFMNSSPVGGGWEGASWQQSGLLGISEVLPMKTKMVKKVKFQLLWDFLSYQQVPRTQPVLFRIGYGF
jgi:hypothetical protein